MSNRSKKCSKLEIVLLGVVIFTAAVTAVTSTAFPECTTVYFASLNIFYLLQKNVNPSTLCYIAYLSI